MTDIDMKISKLRLKSISTTNQYEQIAYDSNKDNIISIGTGNNSNSLYVNDKIVVNSLLTSFDNNLSSSVVQTLHDIDSHPYFSIELSGQGVLIEDKTKVRLVEDVLEDMVLISGLQKKGKVYLELKCSSLKNVYFGMTKIHNDYVKDKVKEGLVCFNSTSERRIGMLIDFSQYKIEYFVEGYFKKSAQFRKEQEFPCMLLSSNDVILEINTNAIFGNEPINLIDFYEKVKENIFESFVFLFFDEKKSESQVESMIKSNMLNIQLKYSQSHLIENINSLEYTIHCYNGVFILEITNLKYLSFDIQITFSNLNDNEISVNQSSRQGFLYLNGNRLENICCFNVSLHENGNKTSAFYDESISYKLDVSNEVLNSIKLYPNKERLFDILLDLNQYLIEKVKEKINQQYEIINTQLKNVINYLKSTNSNILSQGKCNNKVENESSFSYKIEYIKKLDMIILIKSSSEEKKTLIKSLIRNNHGEFDWIYLDSRYYTNNTLNTVVAIRKERLLSILTLLNLKEMLFMFKNKECNQSIQNLLNSIQKSIHIDEEYILFETDIDLFIDFIKFSNVYIKNKLYYVKFNQELNEYSQSSSSYNFGLLNYFSSQAKLFQTSALKEEILIQKKEQINIQNLINEELPFCDDGDFGNIEEGSKKISKISKVSEDIKRKSTNQGLFNGNKEMSKSDVEKFSAILNECINKIENNSNNQINNIDHSIDIDCYPLIYNELYKLYSQIKSKHPQRSKYRLNKFLFNKLLTSSFFPFNPSQKIEKDVTLFNSQVGLVVSHSSEIININLEENILILCSHNGDLSIVDFRYSPIVLFSYSLLKTNYYLPLEEIDFLPWIVKGNSSMNWNCIPYITQISNLFEIGNLNHIKINKTKSRISNIISKLHSNNSTVSSTNSELKPVKTNKKESKTIIPQQEHINNLYVMGFPLEACKLALIENKNNFDKALEYLLEKSSDANFLKQFDLKKEINEKIPEWKCEMCTFENKEGVINCEICTVSIPKHILSQLTEKEKEKNEKEKEKEKKKEEERRIEEEKKEKEKRKIKEIEREILFEISKNKTKPCSENLIIKNVFLNKDITSDGICPYELIVIYHDVIESKVYIEIIKLMLNPRLVYEYITIKSKAEKIVYLKKSITNTENKEYLQLNDLAKDLFNEESLISTYANFNKKKNVNDFQILTSKSNLKQAKFELDEFIKEVNRISNIDLFELEQEVREIQLERKKLSSHILIPIENKSLTIKDVESYYSGFLGKDSIGLLIKNSKEFKKLVYFNIYNSRKDEYNRSSLLVSISNLNGKRNDENILYSSLSNCSMYVQDNNTLNCDLFRTIDIDQLNTSIENFLLFDNKYIYLLSNYTNTYLTIVSKENNSIQKVVSWENQFNIKCVSYTNTSISNLINKIYINTERKDENSTNTNDYSIIEVSLLDNNEESNDDNETYNNKFNINSNTESDFEIENLNKNDFLYLEKLLMERASSIKTNKNIYNIINEDINNSNHIVYFDINNDDLDKSCVLEFGNNLVLGDILKIRLTVIYKSISNKGFAIRSNTNYNLAKNTSSFLTNTYSINKDSHLKLRLCFLYGSKANQNIEFDGILDNKGYVSNYPQPAFLFSHIENSYFSIEKLVFSSNIEPKILDNPFGVGLIFVVNSIEESNYLYEKYKNTKSLMEVVNKSENDFIKPLAYVDMKESLWNIVTVDLSSNPDNKGRYIFLLTLNTRSAPIDLTHEFSKKSLSFNYFGAIGKEINENEYNIERQVDSEILPNYIISLHSIDNKDTSEIISIPSSYFKYNKYIPYFIDTYSNKHIYELSYNIDIVNLLSKSTSLSSKSSLKLKYSIQNYSEIKPTQIKFELFSINNHEKARIYRNFLTSEIHFPSFYLKLINYIINIHNKENQNENTYFLIINFLLDQSKKHPFLTENIIKSINMEDFLLRNILQQKSLLISISSFRLLDSLFKRTSFSMEIYINNILENLVSYENLTSNGIYIFMKLVSLFYMNKKIIQTSIDLIMAIIKKSLEHTNNEYLYINTFIYPNVQTKINLVLNPFDCSSIYEEYSNLTPLFSSTSLSDAGESVFKFKISYEKDYLSEFLKLKNSLVQEISSKNENKIKYLLGQIEILKDKNKTNQISLDSLSCLLFIIKQILLFLISSNSDFIQKDLLLKQMLFKIVFFSQDNQLFNLVFKAISFDDLSIHSFINWVCEEYMMYENENINTNFLILRLSNILNSNLIITNNISQNHIKCLISKLDDTLIEFLHRNCIILLILNNLIEKSKFPTDLINKVFTYIIKINNLQIPFSYKESILELCLNLFIKHNEIHDVPILLINIDSKSNNSEAIKFIISLVTSKSIQSIDKLKPKFIKFLNLVIDPFQIEKNYDLKAKNNNFLNKKDEVFEVISNSIQIIQESLINQMDLFVKYLNDDSILKNKSFDINMNMKLIDFNLEFLVKSYHVNSLLEKIVKSSKEHLEQGRKCLNSYILSNNSMIIDKFIYLISLLPSNNHSSISLFNEVFSNIIKLLHDSSLSLLTHDSCLYNLIFTIFSTFDNIVIQILSSKILFIMSNLYIKSLEEKAEEKERVLFYNQIIKIINYLSSSFFNSDKENESILFMIDMLKIVDGTSFPEEKKDLKKYISLNHYYELEDEKLLLNFTNFLMKNFNYSSFTGVISSSKSVLLRSTLYIHLVNILNHKISFIINSLNNLEGKGESYIRKIYFDIIFWIIFNKYDNIPNQPILLDNLTKGFNSVYNILVESLKFKNLVKIILSVTMKIVKSVDETVFQLINQNRICMKKAIVICDKLFNSLEEILNKCLIDDDSTKYFAFELQGFKFFIERVNTHKKLKEIKEKKDIGQSSNIKPTLEIEQNQVFKLESLIKEINSFNQSSLSLSHSSNFGNESNIVNQSPSNTTENENSDLKNENSFDVYNYYTSSLDNYRYEELALINKLSLLEGDPKKPIKSVSNFDWSAKKRGDKNNIYIRNLKINSSNEEVFFFKMNNIVEVKDVSIGFNFNVGSLNKTSGMIDDIYLEAGETLDNMNICVKLSEIKDNSYIDKGVTAFGFNFFSFSPENYYHIKKNENDEEEYVHSLFSNIINCRARYFKFTVRKPLLTSNENTHTEKIHDSKACLALSFVSIFGMRMVESSRVVEFIHDMEKSISIKIISKIFTSEFIETLQFLAKDSSTIEYIKEIYNAFEPYINNHAEILSNILVNVSKFSFELGEWLLDRLLNIENKEIHAKLAMNIVLNNTEYLNKRLNKYLDFILSSLHKKIFSSSFRNKEKKANDNIQQQGLNWFICYFVMTINNFLIESNENSLEVYDIKLSFKIDTINDIIMNLKDYQQDMSSVLSLLFILIMPNNKIILEIFKEADGTCVSKFNVNEIVSILHQLFQEEYLFEYIELLSLLIGNDKSVENSYGKQSNKEGIFLFYNNLFIEYTNKRLYGKNLFYLMKILKNMSFNPLFCQVVLEKDFNFQILNSIKCLSANDSILLINNSLFLENFIIYLFNSIGDNKIFHKKLAVILINDLQICYQRVDKTYTNKILIPLLRMESKKSSLSSIQSYLSEMVSSEKLLFDLKTDKKYKQQQDKIEFLPSNLIDKSKQLEFETLFKSFEYINGNKFESLIGNRSFKQIFNTKDFKTKHNLTSNSISSVEIKNKVFSTISEAFNKYSNFLFVMSDNKIKTLFYLDSKPIDLPEKIDDSNTYQTALIPFTKKNFIYQTDGVGYICSCFTSEIDDLSNKEYEIGSIYYDNIGANINIANDFLNISIFDLGNSTISPYEEETLGKIIKNNMSVFSISDISDWELFTLDPSTSIESSRIYNKLKEKNNITKPITKSSDLTRLIDINTINIETSSTISTKAINSLPIFIAFEELDGMKTIIDVIKSSIKYWNKEKSRGFWSNWILDVNKFSELPSFFVNLIKHQKCFEIIFNLLCGIYDNDDILLTISVEANRYILEILNNCFEISTCSVLRSIAIEKGIFSTILSQLSLLTREKSRKKQDNKELASEKVENKSNIEVSTEKTTACKPKKGVGYGSDHTGDNKSWDISNYIENKKLVSNQISLIVNILSNFFNSQEFNFDSNFYDSILQSCLLPCIESSLRGGTLLEMSKEESLYYAYLKLINNFSSNKQLIPLLLDIPKDYLPSQTESIFSLLKALNNVGSIFLHALKKTDGDVASNLNPIEEKLAVEIDKTYKHISISIEEYKSKTNDRDYSEIFQYHVSKSYPLLLSEFSFGYMNMKDSHGKLNHLYASSLSNDISNTKLVRLAQEYADLSRSLPIESTNAIYVRVDENNMDFMKVLIMGSSGTPYSNGAFEYDVYFDSQYPNGPPKVTLVTTGNGTVRYNPNLYANGKVCLSLLGTWRGQSTENWDPKISTLLQVLISIQSIIMSDLVYFNEPSCESEMGKPEGEAKNEAYSNIVRYCNIKFAMIEQIKSPSKGFEEVIKRHFFLKKAEILEQVKNWIERSKTAEAKYTSFSYDHNVSWAQKFNQPKKYKEALDKIYIELEEALNSIQIPSDIQKKADESLKRKEKAVKENVVKPQFVNLDNVDVSYETNIVSNHREMNIDNEEVKDRWSRYIGAMGIEAVKKQASANIFISGLTPLGIEISKNLVLSGCKSLDIHDTKVARWEDLSGQFFLSEDDIGVNRAESSLTKLRELNYYVKCNAYTWELPIETSQIEERFKGYSLVILSECSYEVACLINDYCRKNKIKFIYCDLYGVLGRIINDFGNEFTIYDKNGEEFDDVIISSFQIIQDEKSIQTKALVTILEGTKHPYEDDDYVLISEVDEEVSELKSLNNVIFKVKVVDSKSFYLVDVLTKYRKYLRNGKCKYVKMEYTISFDSIRDVLKSNNEKYFDSNMSMYDYTKIEYNQLSHLIFELIDIFKSKKGRLPLPWNKEETDYALQLSKDISSIYKIDLSDKYINFLIKVISTSSCQLPPLSAFLGGFIAQEAIKAITGKFVPTRQVFFFNSIELIPDVNISSEEEINKYYNKSLLNKTRSEGIRIILGDELLNSLQSANTLVVGAGAIGCELLKNFSMIEVASTKGKIIITDPDVIEVSNLNRQFLFREKHLRLQKSSTAAAAIISMNRNLKGKVFAQVDKVCELTETIFNDKFFKSMNFIANALDNITARRYVDSRCVSNRIPLLESGTLGSKGHVQVVIPYKTESYSSQVDPEISNDIPQCTLKMFPEEPIHCIEWSKDKFGKQFTLRPKNLNKTIEEGIDLQEKKVLIQVFKAISNKPTSFDDCIRMGREAFEKYFVNDIKQLMHAYPLNKKNKDGSFFWSLPKRPPVELKYNSDDALHRMFISSFAYLTANMFLIKIPYHKPRSEEARIEISKLAEKYKQKEFVLDIKKIEVMKKEVEKEKEKLEKVNENVEKESQENDENQEKEEDIVNKLKLLLFENKEKEKIKLFNIEEFEKDNDANFHIDYIYSMSNLRSKNYKIDELDWVSVKIKAGRIIPALATTTAAIAGLQALELIKIIKQSPIGDIRNSFVNLAVPMMQASEPGEIRKNLICKENNIYVTEWDRWEYVFYENEGFFLRKLFSYLKEKYFVYPKDCFIGKKAIYSSILYKNSKAKEDIMNKDLQNIIDFNEDDNEDYIDLNITFAVSDESEEYIKNVPKVRIIRKKSYKTTKELEKEN